MGDSEEDVLSCTLDELMTRVEAEADEFLSRKQWSLIVWGYRRFFSSQALLEALTSSPAVSDVSKWVVRWIQQCPEDFSDDEKLRERALGLLTQDAELIMRSYIRVEAEDLCPWIRDEPPEPTDSVDLVRAASELILSYSVEELAHACTCATSRLFMSMTPRDLKAHRVSAFFNRLSWGVGSCILACRTSDQQLGVMARMIDTASCCYNSYDFMSVLAITSGLTAFSVERTRVQDYLPLPYRNTLEELTVLCSPTGNYTAIRSLEQRGLAKGEKVVPMVPIHLRDITVVGECTKKDA